MDRPYGDLLLLHAELRKKAYEALERPLKEALAEANEGDGAPDGTTKDGA